MILLQGRQLQLAARQRAERCVSCLSIGSVADYQNCIAPAKENTYLDTDA